MVGRAVLTTEMSSTTRIWAASATASTVHGRRGPSSSSGLCGRRAARLWWGSWGAACAAPWGEPWCADVSDMCCSCGGWVMGGWAVRVRDGRGCWSGLSWARRVRGQGAASGVSLRTARTTEVMASMEAAAPAGSSTMPWWLASTTL